jgi:hypothetical protein
MTAVSQLGEIHNSEPLQSASQLMNVHKEKYMKISEILMTEMWLVITVTAGTGTVNKKGIKWTAVTGSLLVRALDRDSLGKISHAEVLQTVLLHYFLILTACQWINDATLWTTFYN